MNGEVYELITQAKMTSGNNWGTGVIIRDPVSKKILMGERTDTHNMCTPGGKVEVGETVINGVTRECLEESGLHLLSVKFLGYRVHTSPNGKNWVSFMFFSEDWEGTITPQLSEIRGWNWYDPIDISSMDIFPATDASLQVACQLGLISPVDNLQGVHTETINGDGNGDTTPFVDKELDSQIQEHPAVFGTPVMSCLYDHGASDECCSYSCCDTPIIDDYFSTYCD